MEAQTLRCQRRGEPGDRATAEQLDSPVALKLRAKTFSEAFIYLYSGVYRYLCMVWTALECFFFLSLCPVFERFVNP